MGWVGGWVDIMSVLGGFTKGTNDLHLWLALVFVKVATWCDISILVMKDLFARCGCGVNRISNAVA